MQDELPSPEAHEFPMNVAPPRADVDILFMADFRVGDAGAAQSARWLAALLNSDYVVGVMECLGAAPAEPFALDPTYAELRGHPRFRQIAFDAHVKADLVLACDLRLFGHRMRISRPVECQKRLVVVTRSFADNAKSAAQVLRHAADVMGGTPLLAPAAPSMRGMLERVVPQAARTSDDWVPVLNQPSLNRSIRGAIPALGYYRSGPTRPWPKDAHQLRPILPANPMISLHAYGAPDHLQADLTATSSGPIHFWGGQNDGLTQFLGGLDMMTTTDRAEEDPWPEEIMSGIENGVIPLLDPDYRGNFQSSAIYAFPERVSETAVEFFTSPDHMADVRAAAAEMCSSRFSAETFVERVQDLLGPTYRLPLTSARAQQPGGTVLSISTNGIGMGHLTRQLAIARHLPDHLTPVFFGMSQAVGVMRQFGYVAEYYPSHTTAEMNTEYWNIAFAKAVTRAIAFYEPRALILDANLPFAAFDVLRDNHPGLPMIWVRRAMWGEGRDLPALDKSGLFDLIIEPGEIAGDYDTGPTTGARHQVRPVAPIYLAGPADVLDRADAAAEIGIEPDTMNVLIMAGGRNNFETDGFWSRALSELATWPNTRVVVAEWAITENDLNLPPHVERRRGYPFSRWFGAFDFAMSAAGYNSFAEIMANQLPTVFVPNENPYMDRQDLRSLYAQRHGLGLILRASDPDQIPVVLSQMRDPKLRAGLRAKMANLDIQNGAQEAATLVASLCDSARAHHARAWL